MCKRCWERYGSPDLWNPKVERAVVLVRTIYETECAGGALHVVLDDWNLDGEIRAADTDDEMDPAAVAATEELVPLLNSMTVEERASALARDHGFIHEARARE